MSNAHHGGTRFALLLFAFVLGFAVLGMPANTQAQIGVGISVRVGPPALPVYTQPICPGDGYIWTPGYWAWNGDDYYWVPGTWVVAPQVGFLWTPGYWGWGGGLYAWHAGYWGPHIGFYGGINYGFGYVGVGYQGGYWNHGVFAYNRAYSNVNVNIIHNTYNRTVIVNNSSHVSFNGGRGGIDARPTQEEMAAEHDRHIEATSAQVQHEHAASQNRAQFASVNHGRPAYAATARPGDFSHATPARNAETANRENARPEERANNERANNERENQPRANEAHENQPRANEARENEPRENAHQNQPHQQAHQNQQHQQAHQAQQHKQQSHPQQKGGGGGGHKDEHR